MASNVVAIFNKDGSESSYRLLSGRLPAFLEKFPPQDGWRHIRTVLEASSLTPQLAALHLAAIQSGKEPADVGLASLPRGLVFTSKLLDPQGNEVASGSATSQALDLFAPGMDSRKDYECAETAAFQRLLAALGMGGDVLEQDERQVVAGMGSRIVTSSPMAVEAETVAKAAELPLTVVADDLDLPPMEDPEEALGQVRADTKPVAAAVVSSTSAPASKSGPVVTTPAAIEVSAGARRVNDVQLLAALNRQIVALANKAGVHAAKADSVDAAHKALSELKSLL